MTMNSERGSGNVVVRSVVRIVVLALLAGASIAVGVGATVTWPQRDAAAAAIDVTPTSANRSLICPGPVRRQSSATAQTSGTALGTATLRATAPSGVGIEWTDTGGDALRASAADQGKLAVSSVSSVGSANSGAVPRTTEPVSSAQFAAAQSQSLSESDITGFAIASCATPALDSWLVGGSTATGHSSYLRLLNSGDVVSDVLVSVFTPTETNAEPGQFRVAPHSDITIPLAALAADAAALVVHVTASGAPVAAFVQESVVSGITPQGMDVIGAAAAPASQVTIPAVTVDASGRVTVALFAQTTASADIVAVPLDQQNVGTSATAALTAGEVGVEALNGLKPGRYAISIDSDVAVVAAARATDADTDFAWYTSAQPLTGDTQFIVPAAEGMSGLLALQSGTDVSIAVVDGNGTERTVDLNADVPQQITVTPGGAYTITKAAGVYASVTVQSDGAVASMTVAGTPGERGTVPVYVP